MFFTTVERFAKSCICIVFAYMSNYNKYVLTGCVTTYKNVHLLYVHVKVKTSLHNNIN